MLLDPRTLRAWNALVAVYQEVIPRVVARLEDDAGIDTGVFSVLTHLERAGDEGIRLGALQARMRVRYSQPGLTRAAQRMERGGLLRRHADPTDGRATVLVITDRGRAFHARADEAYRSALAEYLAPYVDDEDVTALLAVLEPLVDRMGAGAGVGAGLRPRS